MHFGPYLKSMFTYYYYSIKYKIYVPNELQKQHPKSLNQHETEATKHD